MKSTDTPNRSGLSTNPPGEVASNLGTQAKKYNTAASHSGTTGSNVVLHPSAGASSKSVVFKDANYADAKPVATAQQNAPTPFLAADAPRQHTASLLKNTCYGRGYETSHQDLADIIDSLH
ncbi:hypothetical protein [Alishewanella tabrizica]|uniref:Uncharacterized protein n=1 Tax=Alishewanella tabrizica TaxID=671278 RepID=A0ABQ2WV75_9ALTE|nr:hypothetical protein [Alishewanella tabrizica]GGW72063.1 hypothetical protein GCM10008111_30310 [Alishewanella tabrizica]